MSVQSMNQEILANVQRANISVEQALALAPAIKKSGLRTISEVILGLPGETYETHLDTLRQLLSAKSDNILVHNCMLLPGSEMNTPQERKKWGFESKFRILSKNFAKLSNGKNVFEIEEVVVALNSLSFDEFLELRILDFMIFVTNMGANPGSGPYDCVLKFVRENNVDVFEIFYRMLKNQDSAPKNIRDVLKSVRETSINELWDSVEEIEAYYQDEKNYIGGAGIVAKHLKSAGAKAVFADVGNDYLINPDKIQKLITKNTKAIIPVHLYGQSCDMEKIYKIAKKYRLKIIEDCAQAQGAKFKNKFVGSYGDTGCFSFYPTKILGAYGDGGFISTPSKNLYEKLKRIRFYGIENYNKKNKFNKKYYANTHGTNSRISELQTAILNLKLPMVSGWIKKRRKLANVYFNQLKNTSLGLPNEKKNCLHVFHLYVVYHPKRDIILKKLKNKNIFLNINYPYPIHKMKAYKHLILNKNNNLKNTEKFSKGIFSLPLYPKLKTSDVIKICKNLKSTLINL